LVFVSILIIISQKSSSEPKNSHRMVKWCHVESIIPDRVYFNVQFYTKCAVLNPFVQFLKHKCAVSKLTKIALIETVFSFTRYPCGCSRKFQKCCH
jgi:hypothetical protein